AGVAPRVPFHAMEPEQFDTLIATNIRSVFLCCRAIWPVMARGGGGVIVNISSLAGDDPFPGFAAYGGTKAFVNVFSQALSDEGAPEAIPVSCGGPGACSTPVLPGHLPQLPL